MIPGTVAIGVVHGGEWKTGMLLCYQDLAFHDLANNRRVTGQGGPWRIVEYCPSGDLVAARNRVARGFLDNCQREWLFIVDTDMGFAPDTIDRLLDAADPTERPVIGGLCFSMKREGVGPFYSSIVDMFPTLYDVYEDDTTAGFVHRLEYPPDELVPVSATGAACLLVHRTVLEQIRAKQGDRWFDKIQHPKQPDAFGEDLSFCLRVQELGLPVFVHTGVKTNHDKGGLQLNEVTFDRQIRAVESEAQRFFDGYCRLAQGALPRSTIIPAAFELVDA